MGKLSKYSFRQIKGVECLNCGQPLTGVENFCSYCGQKNSTKKLSFKHFISQLFSGFFSYDSRFWLTFIPLLIKPGKVSKKYIEGKRSRYVNPFQLYLNVSIIFFLILGFQSNFITNSEKTLDEVKNTLETNEIVLDSTLNALQIDENISEQDKKAITNIGDFFKLTQTQIDNDSIPITYYSKNDSINIDSISFDKKIADFYHYSKTNPKIATENALDSLGYSKSFWNKFYYQQTNNISKNINKTIEDHGESYYKTLISQLSIALFIFLPLFTLFLKILYIRRPFTYMEHLIFVFNTQTVFFLLLILFYLFGMIAKSDSGLFIVVLLFSVYLFLAQKTFYNQGYFKTFIKYIMINLIYFIFGIVGMTIVSLVAFLFV